MAHGLCQVIARESPNVRASALDLPLPVRARSRWVSAAPVRNLDALARAVLSEAAVLRAAGSIAYREGRRFEPELSPVPARRASATGSGRLRDQGVYVITGGLGGIGLPLARYLARQYRARLVLVSRSPVPERAEWQRYRKEHTADDAAASRIAALKELEAQGAELEVVTADVANLDAMRSVFARARQRFGRVSGVFHAAGVLDDALLAQKTLQEAERVLSPKVQGTWALHQLAREAGVELLVLFSSTSTWIAPPGQSDYVAANMFMNAYADSRQGMPGPRTLALQWGVWSDVGMALDALRGRKHGETRGQLGG